MNETESCYEAERIPYHRGFLTRFTDIDAARAYLDHVIWTKWFTNRWPHITDNPPTLKAGTGLSGWSQYDTNTNRITLAKWQLDDMTLLHELAHMITYEPPPNDHGPLFRGVYLQLIARHMGVDAGRSLRHAFLAHGLEQ